MQSLIRNEERAKQLVNFAGMRYEGNKMPTNIDGMFEWKNKCYIFFEAKHVSVSELPLGQRLALERICDDLGKLKPVIVICFSHDTPLDQMIDLASCKVSQCRLRGKWRNTTKNVTVKEVTDWFIRKYGESKDVSQNKNNLLPPKCL